MLRVNSRISGTGRVSIIAAIALATTVLASCTTTDTLDTAPPQKETVKVDMMALPGDYGLAAYHRDEDAERTLNQAKIACSNPYTITAGANGGVMMHYVGQTQPSEIFLKTDNRGNTFLGPKGPTGIPQDREVVSYSDDGTLVVRWMDERAREVYGTLIYVPCGQA